MNQPLCDPVDRRVMTVTQANFRAVNTAIRPREYVVIMPLFSPAIAYETRFAYPAMRENLRLRVILGHYTPCRNCRSAAIAWMNS